MSGANGLPSGRTRQAFPLDRGSSVSTGGPALSDTEVKSDPRLDPGTEISVLFVAEDPEADSIVGSFRVPPSGLPSDKWLQPDDSTTLEPCLDWDASE